MEWKRAYGPELRRLRIERRLTLNQVATAIGRKTGDAVGRYERDDDAHRAPPADTWDLFAKVLGFADAAALFAELEVRMTARGPMGGSRPPLDRLPVDEVMLALEGLLLDDEPWPQEKPKSTLGRGKTGTEGEAPAHKPKDAPLVPRTLWVSAGTASVIGSFLPRLFQGIPNTHRPRLDRLVVLHLSRTACSELRRLNLLDPDFYDLLDTNLRGIERALAPHGIAVERRPVDRVPPWHGFLFGDHLLRGSWQVGRGGVLDVHTLLEHVPLQRDPRAHLEFLMPFFPIFREPAALGLLPGEYAIFGGGPLAIRGLRDPKDADVIVTPAAWNRLVSQGFATEPHDDDLKIQLHLPTGDLEILRSWHPAIAPIAELIKQAEWVQGLPFASLDHVEAWKRAYGRDKDGPDIKRIDAYRERIGTSQGSTLPLLRDGWDPRWGRAFTNLYTEKGYSKTRLAREAGVGTEAVDRLEQGVQSERKTLDCFAEVLELKDAEGLLAALRARRPHIPGLPVGAKVGHVVRAITDPAHTGATLFVYAGIGDVTRTIVSRLVEGDADAPRPTIAAIVFYRFSEAKLAELEAAGELAPGFAQALHTHLAGLRSLSERAGLRFEERDYPRFPAWHGYVVGDHAFVGRWELDSEGHWHGDSRVTHVVRGRGHPDEASIWALAR